MLDMFDRLCARSQMIDVSVVVNRHDCPIIGYQLVQRNEVLKTMLTLFKHFIFPQPSSGFRVTFLDPLSTLSWDPEQASLQAMFNTNSPHRR